MKISLSAIKTLMSESLTQHSKKSSINAKIRRSNRSRIKILGLHTNMVQRYQAVSKSFRYQERRHLWWESSILLVHKEYHNILIETPTLWQLRSHRDYQWLIQMPCNLKCSLRTKFGVKTLAVPNSTRIIPILHCNQDPLITMVLDSMDALTLIYYKEQTSSLPKTTPRGSTLR